MPIQNSGAVSIADIARIVYNNSAAATTLNDNDVRLLLSSPSGSVLLSSSYSKPTPGNTGLTYYTPGTYSWVTVPYQFLTAQVAAGGGAGGGYCGGQQVIVCNPFPFCVCCACVNPCNSGSGNAGGQSSFNGVTANGGGGGLQCNGGVGAAGGNNQNGNTGGGGAFGAGNTNPADTNCNQASGSNGGAGGFAQRTWTKAVNGPGYGVNINFTVGAGGAPGAAGCRDQRGAAGSNGWVYIAWS